MTAMSDLATRLALKERLPRAWPAFFERHGNFTPIQLAAMPPLLAGRNVIICAPTAGGKTEAALAPLVERHCLHHSRGPIILYIAPTRALVNDLAARLEHPLQALGLTQGIKTGDITTWRPARPPHVLITTPESLDSLLCSRAKLLATPRAVVLDELHLLDGTARGDQLRVLLNRLRRVRAYAHQRGDAPDAALQYAAVSATLAHPATVAARYFPAALVVQIAGARAMQAAHLSLAPEGVDELLSYLQSFPPRGWRKALLFCNSRAEVEAYATVVRGRTPFGGAVYVHYSNIEAKRRRATERHFAAASAALLCATSTLELGVDIGDIDVVILVGPPGSTASFVQRIGRGNRRQDITRVACLYRSPLERLIFAALTAEAPASAATEAADSAAIEESPDRVDGEPGTRPRSAMAPGATRAPEIPAMSYESQAVPFRPSVAVQQIFSLLKQSPTGSVRLAELSALWEGMLQRANLEAILEQLHRTEYLTIGRPGEWGAGRRLNELYDRQGSPRCELSIYSNIQGVSGRTIDIRDQHTQEIVATVDKQWLDRPVLTLEGRPVSVEWYDGEAMWVATYQGRDAADRLRYRSERQLLSHELATLLPRVLGLSPGVAPVVPAPGGWWWFHWLGDLYGHALFDLVRYTIRARETAQPGLCLWLPDEPRTPPSWTEEQVRRYLADNYRELEPLLALGPFHQLLPASLRRRAVVEQFDTPRFLDAVAALRPSRAPESVSDDLARLLE